MIKKYSFILLLFVLSCDNSLEHDFTEEQIKAESAKFGQRSSILKNKNIRLVEVIDFPLFDDVNLSLLVKNAKYIQGKNKLEFGISGFNLGNKTVSEKETDLPFEEGGQYLVIGTNHQEPENKFSNTNEIELLQGDNYLFAFLCRSYKMSLKGKQAGKLYKITTNSKDGFQKEEKNEPFVYLNEPNGKFDYSKSKKLLLDFYLFNVELKPGGNYLLVNIDGEQFKIYKWAPFYIEGLGYGKHNISISLKTAQGASYPGKLINEITREFEISDNSIFSE